ncbi:MAG: SOS response-associated peptidase [Aggregatilineales bacterium]
MCGRFVLIADPAEIYEQFELPMLPEVQPRYNIAPTQSVPVIVNQGGRALHYYRWGLIPSWAKDPQIGSRMINARAETVAEKPAFRAAFKRRRCIVPCSGFYEWQQRKAGKVPMYIHLRDQPLFGFAGLWEIWNDPSSEEVRSFTIITTEANAMMREIHDRMPVILQPEHYATWLQSEDVPQSTLQELLRPYAADRMVAYEVSKLVNRPAVDSPACIAPVG